MPDTGAPWNIPYVAGTDLVSDWPTDSQALANSIASGLTAAQGIIAVKHALFTGTQTNSTAAGGNFAITSLSITHALSDASNKLIISAFVGAAANSNNTNGVGLAVADDGTLIGIGDAASSRTRVSSGGATFQSGADAGDGVSLVLTTQFVYAPGDTASHTYTARGINVATGTETIYINRTEGDANGANRPRAASALVIQEVNV